MLTNDVKHLKFVYCLPKVMFIYLSFHNYSSSFAVLSFQCVLRSLQIAQTIAVLRDCCLEHSRRRRIIRFLVKCSTSGQHFIRDDRAHLVSIEIIIECEWFFQISRNFHFLSLFIREPTLSSHNNNIEKVNVS